MSSSSPSSSSSSMAAAVEEEERERGERKVGRAAMYMRDLISRQVKANQLSRAGSLTDSAALRRKGRLKEQDPFIEFIVRSFQDARDGGGALKAREALKALAAAAEAQFANIYRQVPKQLFFHSLSRCLSTTSSAR